MIGKLILMFIPSAVSLGLLGIYLMAEGVPIGRSVLILVVSALLMSWLMAKIALEDEYFDEEDEKDDD